MRFLVFMNTYDSHPACLNWATLGYLSTGSGNLKFGEKHHSNIGVFFGLDNISLNICLGLV